MFIDPKINGIKQTMSLEKCPDKLSNIVFTICAVADNTNLQSDTMSEMISEVASEDFGCDSEYNFGDIDSTRSSEKPLGSRISSFSGGHDANALINRIKEKKVLSRIQEMPAEIQESDEMT